MNDSTIRVIARFPRYRFEIVTPLDCEVVAARFREAVQMRFSLFDRAMASWDAVEGFITPEHVRPLTTWTGKRTFRPRIVGRIADGNGGATIRATVQSSPVLLLLPAIAVLVGVLLKDLIAPVTPPFFLLVGTVLAFVDHLGEASRLRSLLQRLVEGRARQT